MIVNEKQLPEMSWTFDDGQWSVQTSQQPVSVLHWQATNPIARDFRKETLGAKYTSQSLQASSQGVYTAQLEAPPEGWTASFVETTFDVGAPFPLKFTTGVRVAPDVLPFAHKDATKDASLTVTFEAKDGKAAAEVLATLNALVASGAMKAPHYTAEQFGSRVYVNWQPPLEDFERAAVGLTRLLSEKGCTAFAYQLESGLGATVAPGLRALASP